jgi:hypothetical protein
MGARASGLGSTSSCLTDEWSIFNNVAGLAHVNQTSAAFTYRAYPSIKSFNSMAGVFAIPLKWGVAGAGVYRFGDDLYNEHVLSAAFSNRFGIASLGIKVNYIQYHAEGFGTKGVFTVSFGGIAQLTKMLSVGAHIININQPRVSSNDREETVPTILIAGIGVKISEKLFATSEIEKDIAYKPIWKTGLEYVIHPKISVRTGFHINPSAGFFGVGFKPRKFILDYAYEYNFQIGANHQASVGYKFQSK